jgi:hypothetical protein
METIVARRPRAQRPKKESLEANQGMNADWFIRPDDRPNARPTGDLLVGRRVIIVIRHKKIKGKANSLLPLPIGMN